ncbi:MAG: DUF5680 domain-containing protein [Nanoarchaeota archaeon]
MKIGKLDVDLEELQHFVVKAKKNGYASGKKKLIEIDGSKTFVFQEGNFHYTDNYAGSYQAPGNEIIRWGKKDGQRIWCMSYSGGMLPKYWNNIELTKKTYEFLKKVLMDVNFKHPFRGLPEHKSPDFIYNMNIKGDIKRFSGKEFIHSKKLEKIVFLQDFIGGLVIIK